MFYEIAHNVPVPKNITNDTARGRRKYPFEEMKPIDPQSKTGDCLEVRGEEAVKLALVRMRGVAREKRRKFIAEKIKQKGKVVSVKIFRVA